MSTKLDRLTELAKEEPKRQFFSIAHLITPETLYAAFRSLRKDASAGMDGVTYEEYQQDAERKIQELYQRLKDGKYQAQPLRRVYIPKENGKQRPISIPALEDKIVQKAMVEVLNAIYEQDFLDCSYGFRPGRGQHQALDEVKRVICTRSTGWILELDITAYFDSIVREQLMVMIEKRVSDSSVLRLIRKWIQVGVVDQGQLLVSDRGTGQGQTISPLLANIYLHHGAPGQTWCFQRVKFPPRQEVQPPQRESSLGSEEATNRAKRRQSDERAVTKVKRLSLVKYLTAGRQHRSGWEAPVGAPQTARWPETAAGSVSTARSDREASRDLGDPLWSWSAHKTGRVCRTIGIIPEKGRRHSAKSDSLVVLRARESRAHGKRRSR
jgi:Reverse transcriptase (RNA-dependent DNA polymerase)